MSTSIYIPYFYIIQHINSGKYYAGVKYGKNANPDNLLKSNGYQTSSYTIKNIILEEGLDSFVIRKIKAFETGEQALDYESRFLRRVNASFNDSFLNRSNNSISVLNIDYEKTKQTNLDRYGYEFSFQNEEVKEKHKQTMIEKHGFENASQVPAFKNKKMKTCLDNFGVEYPQQSEEVRNKSKQTNFEHRGYEYPMQSKEVREKSKQSCLETYGVEYISQSTEIREKIKETNLSKYGVEHPMQSPELKEKRKQKHIFLSNQPLALEILKYKEKYNLKFNSYWMYKPQEFLDKLLEDLKMTYGTMTP